MVISEDKIIANIEKVKKLINPKAKKQIIKLDNDTYFKDLVESIKSYLIEYPDKKAFPATVYKGCYDLIEFATSLFEENNKQIGELIKQREDNIKLAGLLKEALEVVSLKEDGWIAKISKFEDKFDAQTAKALSNIANFNPEKATDKQKEQFEISTQMVKTKITNLEQSLFIEIDIERIEDRSKALSYIGIEVSEALRQIPAPVAQVATVAQAKVQTEKVQEKVETPVVESAPEVNVAAAAVQEVEPTVDTIAEQEPETLLENVVEKIEENVQEEINNLEVLTAQEELIEQEEKEEKLDNIEKIEEHAQENLAQSIELERKDIQEQLDKIEAIKESPEVNELEKQFMEATTLEVDEPKGFWAKFKANPIIKAISFIFTGKISIELPALNKGTEG